MKDLEEENSDAFIACTFVVMLHEICLQQDIKDCINTYIEVTHIRTHADDKV